MNIIELKDQILNKTLSDDLLVLKYSDNTFLCNQYIDEISKIRKLNKVYIDDINEALDSSDSVFFDEDKSLYILSVDKFELLYINPSILKNTIVKCKSIESDKVDAYVVEMPKLIDWQILDYMTLKMPGLNINEIKWLCNITNNDIYRLVNEADKINIFDKDDQKYIFQKINEDNGYMDLNPLTIFDFTNAILKKDRKKICEILRDLQYIDVEPTGVVTILYKNFKNIINVQLNSSATAESISVSSKQFFAIKNNCGYYSKEQLLNIFNILTKIDYKLKNGELPNELIIDYILSKLF